MLVDLILYTRPAPFRLSSPLISIPLTRTYPPPPFFNTHTTTTPTNSVLARRRADPQRPPNPFGGAHGHQTREAKARVQGSAGGGRGGVVFDSVEGWEQSGVDGGEVIVCGWVNGWGVFCKGRKERNK